MLYILFAHVLTGVASVEDFRTAGSEASVAYAITTYMPGYGWLAKLVTVAILAGFSSVILVMLMGQSRVFYSMSRDGLVPAGLLRRAPEVPHAVEVEPAVLRASSGCFAAFVPGDIVGDMTSIGTLFAFMLVCIGVWIMRVREPELPRQFSDAAGAAGADPRHRRLRAMIFGLGWTNWPRLGVWLVIGLVIYFTYGRQHSKLAAGG